MRSFVCLTVLLHLVVCEIAPKFNNTPESLKVKEGTRAILPCSVDFIGGHKVVWSSPRKTLISLEDRRLIDDQRISVERPFVKEWNLHIRSVRYNDSGEYKCEINTSPVQFKIVYLSVLVPPSIHSKVSSDNLKLKETETAELICNVTGVPHPNVTWFKRNFRLGRGHKERIGLEGEVLIIHNVTRYCDDIYECYVDNGVPPAVSKAIRVVVEFPPEVILTNKRIGQRLGRETILECNIYGYPQSLTLWKRNGRTIVNNERFTVDAYEDPDPGNRILTLSLRINRIRKEDFGKYVCEGSNYLGIDREEMILYEIEPVKTTTTTTTISPTRGRYEPYPHHFNSIDDKGGDIDGYGTSDLDRDSDDTYISDKQRPDSASTMYPSRFPDNVQPARSSNGYSGGSGRSDPRSILPEHNRACVCKPTIFKFILTVANIYLCSYFIS